MGEDSPLATLNDFFKYHRKNEVIMLKSGAAENYNATENTCNDLFRQSTEQRTLILVK
ncbi:hypothetical protein [Allomuricauda sp. F6463D]|uniref:hypothetical protein n=1 Tax=Allomuricauda sp. F6463D TaxID=2926409 RepID=UPI001FF53669|nr:hypothetical protein [Muricauda sp. F6463D]MCK0160049.1 hypothetical protein [Muricauda sp. F6463D]